MTPLGERENVERWYFFNAHHYKHGFDHNLIRREEVTRGLISHNFHLRHVSLPFTCCIPVGHLGLPLNVTTLLDISSHSWHTGKEYIPCRFNNFLCRAPERFNVPAPTTPTSWGEFRSWLTPALRFMISVFRTI